MADDYWENLQIVRIILEELDQETSEWKEAVVWWRTHANWLRREPLKEVIVELAALAEQNPLKAIEEILELIDTVLAAGNVCKEWRKYLKQTYAEIWQQYAAMSDPLWLQTRTRFPAPLREFAK